MLAKAAGSPNNDGRATRLAGGPRTMPESITFDVPDLAATTAFGRRLARLLFPGSLVALIGPLGAGKTHLVRAVAEGLGVADGRVVNSPTFVLIQEYNARLPIYHFDAYRLRSPAEFFDLGAHEYFEGNGVCLVEWADRVLECLPTEHLRIRIEVTGETSRRVTAEAYGEGYAAIVRTLRRA
jgi:tRNA threonylcarbamoyladenosine biosynthesis protein TsaE